MTFDRNQLTGLSAKPDISFLDDKFDPNMFQNGVHVDANGNATRLAENWEDILADLNESGFQL